MRFEGKKLELKRQEKGIFSDSEPEVLKSFSESVCLKKYNSHGMALQYRRTIF